jgi:hypothetical protein
VEAISPHRFDLEKGGSVLVEFPSRSVLPLSSRKVIGWLGLWALRRPYIYSHDIYYQWAQNLAERYPAWFGQQRLRGAYWTPGSETEIVSFGPQEVVRGVPFNQQPDGRSAMWVRTLRDPPAGAVIEIAGTVLQTSTKGTLLSAPVPAAATAAGGELRSASSGLTARHAPTPSPCGYSPALPDAAFYRTRGALKRLAGRLSKFPNSLK